MPSIVHQRRRQNPRRGNRVWTAAYLHDYHFRVIIKLMNMNEKPIPPKKPIAAQLLGAEAVVGFAIAIVLVFGFSAILARSVLQGQMAAVISAALVELTNGDRTQGKIGTLTVNPLLVAAAQAKANDMATKGYFAHISPNGRDSWTWFKDAGYAFSYAGENLAVNFSDSEDVEQAWMDSPTHRANILNGHFTEIGIATAVGTYKGRSTTFVVQMFGRPGIAAVAPIRTLTSLASSTQTAVATTEHATSTKVLGATVEEIPPPAPAVAASAPTSLSFWNRILSAPRALLRDIYITGALLLLIILAAATGLELKKHHLKHVFAAGCLLILMFGLSVVADYLIFSKPVLGMGVEQSAV